MDNIPIMEVFDRLNCMVEESIGFDLSKSFVLVKIVEEVSMFSVF